MLVSACEGEQHAFLSYTSAHFDRPDSTEVRDDVAPMAVGAEVELAIQPPPFDGGDVVLLSVASSDPGVATVSMVDDKTLRITAVADGSAELVVEHSDGEEITATLSVHEPAEAFVTPVDVAFVPREHWADNAVALDGAGLAVGLRHLDDRGRTLLAPWHAWALEGRTDALLEANEGERTATVFGGELTYRVVGGQAAPLTVGAASTDDITDMDVFVEGHGLKRDGETLEIPRSGWVKIVALPRTADGATAIAHGYIPRVTLEEQSEYEASVHGARLCSDQRLGCIDTSISLFVWGERTETVRIQLLGQTVELDVTVG